MKLKVCGLKKVENIKELIKLEPDFIGFIFYSKSKRYMVNELLPEDLKFVPKSIKKVGVFVDENISNLKQHFAQYELDFVQLHGNEGAEYCKELTFNKIPIIKAFQVDDSFDLNILNDYEPYCDYFLFDTKGKLMGGNGIKFNWEVLKNYKSETPFLLSGGLDLEDAETVKSLILNNMIGVDINSKFEIEPGLKDIEKVKSFKQNLQKWT